MKTKFTRFGKSAVSIVLSTVILLSVMIANAETIESQSSGNDETVSNNTVTVDITPDDVTQTVMDVEDVRANSEDDSAAAESVKNDEEESQLDSAEVKTEDVKADTAVQANSKKSEVKKTPEASGVGKGDTIYFIDTDYTDFGSVYIYLIADESFHEMARVRKGSNIYYYTLTANYTNNTENFLFVNKNSWTGQKQTENVKFSTSNNVYYPTTKSSSGYRNVASTNFDTLGFSVEDYDDTAKFYYKNEYNWSNPTLYAWYATSINNVAIQIKCTGYWPGTRMDKTLEDGVYSAVVPTKINKLIVNNGDTSKDSNGNSNMRQTINVGVTTTNISAKNSQMLKSASLEGSGGNTMAWENHSVNAETTELTVILKDGTLRSDTRYEKYSNFADSKFREIDGVARNDSKIGNVTIDDGFGDQAEVAVIPRGSTIKFRTKIDAGHCDKYYVKAFDVNGETIFPTKEGDNTYVGEYTIPNDLEVSKLEITPIYFYNEGYDRNREFITFIVENFDGDVKSEWGKKVDNTEGTPILACYAWYDHQVKDSNGNVIFDPDTESAGSLRKSALGGYPGQPMVYEDGHYIMQVPVTDDNGSHIQGITLNNYVWDRVHCQALGAYSDTQRKLINCQTYDADDFVVLSNATPAPEFIAMRFKYRTNKNFHEGTATYDARYSGNQPADDDASTLTLTHYDSTNGNGWDDYLDYNGRTIDLFNYVLSGDEASSAPFYIVSDGYQEIYYGHFGTIWYIYDSNRKFVGKLPSSALLYTPTDGNGNALDLYTVMDKADRNSVPTWFLPFYSNTEYNPTISSTDRDTAKKSYWQTYYDLYNGNNTVPAKKHPAKITFETAIRAKDSGINSHVIDPALRNDVRWYYSRISDINAEIKIEYTTTSDSTNFIQDSFNTTATGATAPYAGSATNAHAYFTNTSVSQLNSTTGEYETVSIANEYKVTGIKSSTDSVKDRFAFEADSISKGTFTIDGQTVNKTFLFEGWYRVVDGVYSKLTSEEKIDAESAKTLLESSVDMRNSVTLVARYVPLSGDELIITHDLYKNADKYTNSPAVLNGTGTPRVSVYVVDENNNNKTIKIPYSKLSYNQVAIDKTTLQLYQASGYKLVVTLDVTPDSNNTYETTYLKTITDSATEKSADSGYNNGYYYPYTAENVAGPASAGTWNAAKTENQDQVVYSTAISALLNITTNNGTTTTSLKTNNIRFYSQLSTSVVNIKFKYYDREMADNSQPTNIKISASEFTTTQTLNTTGANAQEKIDNTVGAGVIELIEAQRVDNVIDQYFFWASQTQAAGDTGLKARTDTSRDYSNATLTYHTDYYGRSSDDADYMSEALESDEFKNATDAEKTALKQEKWVTYKDIRGKEITTITDVKEIASVVVWGFNYPKTYKMTFKDQGLAETPVNGIYLAQNAKADYTNKPYYYNQRVGALEDNRIIDDVSPHLKEYDIAQGVNATVVKAENKTGYVFDGWYENINDTYVKVSSDQTYGNRVTKGATLIAGYRLANVTAKKGIAVTKNETEKYVDSNNVDRVRYVTVLNAYGFNDSDPNFESVSVVYVKLPTDLDAESSNITINTLLGDTKFTGDLQSALDRNRTDGERDLDKSTVTVEVNNVEITSNTISYTYDIVTTYTDGTDNESITRGNQIKFTNKNRAQFVLDLKATTVAKGASSSNLLVFTEVKYKDDNVKKASLITAYKAANNDEEPNEAQLTAYLNSYLASTYGTAVSADTTKGYVYIASDNYVVYNNN